MVEIGAIIAAKVRDIVPYGIWLDYEGQKVLVLITDISWRPVGHPLEAVEVGQIVNVKVMRYNYKKREIVASMKALDPDGNPYRQLSRLEPGTVMEGVVIFVAGDVITVRLPNLVWGNVPKHCYAKEPQPGDKLALTIASMDVEEGRLYLEPPLQQKHAGIEAEANLVPT